MRALGCLFLLFVAAVIAGELFLIIWLGALSEEIGGTFTIIVITFALSFIGFRLAKYRGKQIPQAMLSGQIGKAAGGMIGAILMTIPGLATGAVGLLLQLPPIQAMLSGIMHKIFLTFTATAMQRMAGMGGKAGAGMGGFPGAGGQAGANPFAGGMTPEQMQQLQKMMGAMGQQQQSASGAAKPNLGGLFANRNTKGKKTPKTYDVKLEK